MIAAVGGVVAVALLLALVQAPGPEPRAPGSRPGPAVAARVGAHTSLELTVVPAAARTAVAVRDTGRRLARWYVLAALIGLWSALLWPARRRRAAAFVVGSMVLREGRRGRGPPAAPNA
jgi:hypothetical protein